MLAIENKKHCAAIVLAAGQGKRMGTSVQKQYIELEGKPLIYYSLKTFQESGLIDSVVLVVGEGQVAYAQNEIVLKYGFSKVCAVVEGGKERYDSVWQGLKTVSQEPEVSYIYIHDGARPFVDDEILNRGYETVEQFRACVAGMPSKDTVKVVDEQGFAINTPERKYVWVIQTPQIFEKSLIMEAYARLMKEEHEDVTDDAMAVERMMKVPVKMFEGSYQNVKITTPEDLAIAKVFLREK
ncbi:MAG: 2-C-methyl-D-erythritol 4-phosphate cytidylyltransferase [Dorea sp.]|jgi:2-C-methyl-D-erythritol 4-phosphate cytidylyltransferase|nr:2-C-methyl-D-erythritol 4-phosphate cytidylyltransferase [Dorea sp.]